MTIPPGNRVKPMPTALRWLKQSQRALRGLWWIEQIAYDKTADEQIDPLFVSELKEALLSVVEALEAREKRDALRGRIAQLESVDGRTPEEEAAYLAKARQLREQHGE